MAPPSTINSSVAVVSDADLQLFLDGKLREPEDRVSRRGVPDNRVREHEPRPFAEIWKSVKPKIERQARIRGKAARFRYQPIASDQIRLLRIRPGKPSEDVDCDLCVKSLAEFKGKYEALSYCWGMEEPDEAIYIYQLVLKDSGPNYTQLPRAEFPVRSNLLKALRHLRRTDRGVVVWIDAICINQRPTPEATMEKNQQLSMMSDIYNSAKNVCIWLGDADQRGESVTALKLVKAITNFKVLDMRLQSTDEDTEKCWCNLVNILKSTQWFSRRWIIQEIASARNASVHFGDDVIHWDDLADAISLLQENHEVLKERLNHELFDEVPALSATQLVKALTTVCRKTPTGEIAEKLLDLETLVCTFQQFQARFPQDVIHSVRALARDSPGEKDKYRLGVHHEKSTRDLFIAFVKRCIDGSDSLDIICRHWAPPVTDSAGEEIKLPTWISELSNGPFGLPGESHERQNGENFVALSPHDKRKRYNASQDWGKMKLQTLVSTHIVPPTLAISQSNGSEVSRRRALSDAPFMTSPLASPALEAGNPFQAPTIPFLGAAAKHMDLKIPPQIETREDNLSPMSTSNGHQSNGFAARPSVENGESAKDGTGEISNVAKPPGHVLPFRHRRATTVSSSLAPVPEDSSPSRVKAKEFLDVLTDAAMFPGRLKQHKQATRKDSRSKRDSWIQTDQEHNQDGGVDPILEVVGFILGTVRECSDLMRDGIVPGDWLEKLGWVRNSPDNRVPDILWRTLVADRNPDGGNPPNWYKRACLHCLKDTRLINSKGDLNAHKKHRVTESMTSMYLKRVESVIWRRRIVKVFSELATADRFLYGLAPEKTKEGDIVCILDRCSVPVVLRKAGYAGLFSLVGEAYIHGKMDGEAVQDALRNDLKKVKFGLQ